MGLPCFNAIKFLFFFQYINLKKAYTILQKHLFSLYSITILYELLTSKTRLFLNIHVLYIMKTPCVTFTKSLMLFETEMEDQWFPIDLEFVAKVRNMNWLVFAGYI